MALAPTSCPAASPVIVFLASLGVAGCAIVRVPPHAAQSRFGVVHAVDSETAGEYARLLDRVGTVVSQALPGLAVEPVDVRIVEGVTKLAAIPVPAEFSGAAFERGSERWIELRSDLEPLARPQVLAHELVHRWLGPVWSTLPPALEDGLCEAIAIATHDGRTVQDRTSSFLSAWLTLNDSLIVDQDGNPANPRHETYTVRLRSKGSRLSPSDVVEAMRRDLRGYFEIGDGRQFVTVNLLSRLLLDRLTIARLFELCLEAEEHGLARVPPERAFETAGIDPLDPETWNEMLLGLYGAPERRALCEQARIPRKAHSSLSSGGQPEERVTVRLEARVTF